MSARTIVRVDQRELELSNLDKILYPAADFTKAQVLDYYRAIAPVMLLHLAGRPLTLRRFPDGVDGESFYEKECPPHRPDWLPTVSINSERAGRRVNFCVVNDLPALLWAANLASLEFHTSLARIDDLARPTSVAFDLDPGPGTTILDCVRLAVELRKTLADLGLVSLAKTSGGKGLHIFVPLNAPATFEETKTFARALAYEFQRRRPNEVTANMRKEMRNGKVFIDWSQNTDYKSTICAYSLRARERPTASTPVTWEELTRALEHDDPGRLVFEADAVVERIQRKGDLFRGMLETKQKLPG
jgi:bifunctional non-homologous end joining protein LigD